MATARFIPVTILLMVLHGSAALGGQADLNAFARVQLAMSEDEVVNLLGPPDQVEEISGVDKRGNVRITIKKFSYISEPERAQDILTTITFENGKVRDKQRTVR